MRARPWLVRRAGGSGGLLGQLAQGVFEGARPRFQGDGTHVDSPDEGMSYAF